MRPIKTLLIVALASIGLAAAVDVNAASRHGGGGMRGAASGGHGGGHWGGSGHGHGGSGGHWHGASSGHWHGGHGGHYYYRGYYPYYGWGWAWGLPLYAAWWGYPYYYSSYPYYYDYGYSYPAAPAYAPSGSVYGEREVAPPETTQVPPATQDSPRQGPLYMNYCESAKAYYPKVTSCPEGWKFISPRS